VSLVAPGVRCGADAEPQPKLDAPGIIAECALGIVSCPVTRCFSFAVKSRVVFVPYIHPRMSPILYREHVQVIRSMGCAVVLEDDDLLWRDKSAWVETERAVAVCMVGAFHPMERRTSTTWWRCCGPQG